MTRRDVLRDAAALAGSACLCQASPKTCCITPEIEPGSVEFEPARLTVDLAKARSLAAPSASANLIDDSRGLDLILIHVAPGEYAVLSGLCTHYPRPLTYIPSRRVLQCNNFNHSIFGLDGSVVKGPAPKPIRKYAARVTEGKLVVEL